MQEVGHIPIPQALLGRVVPDMARSAIWRPEAPHCSCGYAKLIIDYVSQTDKGADLVYLICKDTRLVTREAH